MHNRGLHSVRKFRKFSVIYASFYIIPNAFHSTHHSKIRYECMVNFRFMPDVPEAVKQSDNRKFIETAFGVLCNMPLLNNHSASWEILVSKRHISNYNNEGNLTAHIPVTFNDIPLPFNDNHKHKLHDTLQFYRFYSVFIIHLAMVWLCFGYF